MFLKNELYLLHLLVIVFYFFSFKAHSASEDKAEVLRYLSSLSDFSASFLQSDGESLSEVISALVTHDNMQKLSDLKI